MVSESPHNAIALAFLLPAAQMLPHTLHAWLGLLGRTHVVIIHFPIALLLMAALGEIWGKIRGQPAPWTTATLTAGALAAVLAMTLGWLLVCFRGYEPSSTLTLHQYLGTATALVAILAAALHWMFPRQRTRWWTTSLILAAAAMVGLTGHLGGTLVHGPLF